MPSPSSHQATHPGWNRAKVKMEKLLGKPKIVIFRASPDLTKDPATENVFKLLIKSIPESKIDSLTLKHGHKSSKIQVEGWSTSSLTFVGH